jgi:hypothetical protein
MDDNYDRLTNEAKMILLKMYYEYTLRIAAGTDRRNAKVMGPLDRFKPFTLPNESDAELVDYCGELAHEEFLSIKWADGTVYFSSLTNVAIARMQNRFKDGVKAAIELLTKVL